MVRMDARQWFGTAAQGFREVVAGIVPAQLDAPGLGEWDVRALLGHASRACTTIETYLGATVADIEVTLAGPADYFRAAAAGLADPAQVTQRGREAGAALGKDPVIGALAIIDRVVPLVSSREDDAPVATPVGAMRLVDYLPTRAFELTVHGLDLAAATGGPVPDTLSDGTGPAIDLCVELADQGSRRLILRALTGRGSLPPGFTVL